VASISEIVGVGGPVRGASGGFSVTRVLLPSSTKMTLRLLNLKTVRLHGDMRLKISDGSDHFDVCF